MHCHRMFVWLILIYAYVFFKYINNNPSLTTIIIKKADIDDVWPFDAYLSEFKHGKNIEMTMRVVVVNLGNVKQACSNRP